MSSGQVPSCGREQGTDIEKNLEKTMGKYLQSLQDGETLQPKEKHMRP